MNREATKRARWDPEGGGRVGPREGEEGAFRDGYKYHIGWVCDPEGDGAKLKSTQKIAQHRWNAAQHRELLTPFEPTAALDNIMESLSHTIHASAPLSLI